MSTMFTRSMRKQFDEVLQKNEQDGPSSNHEGVELPKMDSKDMLPSTMMNRSWKLLLKKIEKNGKIPCSFIENDCCCNGTKDFARTYL